MRSLEGARIQLSGEPGGMDNYIAAFTAAGARPVPGCCPAPDLSCDGLVLCGGGDMDPALFGQKNQGSHPPDRERDQAELALFHAYFQAGKPILGICRGMQVINVALGGTLIQDLPPEIRPRHTAPGGDVIHPVQARRDTLLHDLYGPRFFVNSAHHQAVNRLGEGLRATAWAEEGFPEALDWIDRRIMAFQFHPERMAYQKHRPDTIDAGELFQIFEATCWWNDD